MKTVIKSDESGSTWNWKENVRIFPDLDGTRVPIEEKHFFYNGFKVFLNGQDISHFKIYRLRTGLRGYVDLYVVDNDGALVIVDCETIKATVRGPIKVTWEEQEDG